MKKILLIGDSIRIGYDKYVKKVFEMKAEVYYPNENCRFTSYIIRQLSEWKIQLGLGNDIDLVHWNAGLWDDLVMLDGKHLISIDLYKENIERICCLIEKLFPKAKMIFATSTPVQEELFTAYKRYNSDTEIYNAAAIEIIGKHNGKVNDLYLLMKNASSECYSDSTHFYTKIGAELITKQVVRCIENELGIKGNDFDYDSLFMKEGNQIGI